MAINVPVNEHADASHYTRGWVVAQQGLSACDEGRGPVTLCSRVSPGRAQVPARPWPEVERSGSDPFRRLLGVIRPPSSEHSLLLLPGSFSSCQGNRQTRLYRKQTGKPQQRDQRQGPFAGKIAPVGPLLRRQIGRGSHQKDLDGDGDQEQPDKGSEIGDPEYERGFEQCSSPRQAARIEQQADGQKDDRRQNCADARLEKVIDRPLPMQRRDSPGRPDLCPIPRGGWEGGLAVEIEKAQIHENAQKNAVRTLRQLHALLACGLLPVTMLFAIARPHMSTTKVYSRT